MTDESSAQCVCVSESTHGSYLLGRIISSLQPFASSIHPRLLHPSCRRHAHIILKDPGKMPWAYAHTLCQIRNPMIQSRICRDIPLQCL